MASPLQSRVRRAGTSVVLDIRRRLAEVQIGAERLDATFASRSSGSLDFDPAAVEELAQLGCRLIELAAALAEGDDNS